MDFIMIPLVVGICIWGFYKFFELIIGRRERLSIIEKLESSSLTDYLARRGSGIAPMLRPGGGVTALTVGCLLLGLGVGMLFAFMLLSSGSVVAVTDSMQSAVYGGSVLCFGGLGLVIAFVIERLLMRKN